MRTLNIYLNGILKYLIENMGIACCLTSMVGAIAVSIASAMSVESINSTVRHQIPLASLCYFLGLILVLSKSKYASISFQKIHENISKKNLLPTSQILKQHIPILLVFLSLLFWAGWMIFGMLLILFVV